MQAGAGRSWPAPLLLADNEEAKNLSENSEATLERTGPNPVLGQVLRLTPNKRRLTPASPPSERPSKMDNENLLAIGLDVGTGGVRAWRWT